MRQTVVAVPDRMTDFVDAFKVNSRTLTKLHPGFALALVIVARSAGRSRISDQKKTVSIRTGPVQQMSKKPTDSMPEKVFFRL